MARPKKAAAKRGRPSKYTPEIAKVICERLATGETLRAICRTAGMPTDFAVRRWALDDVDGFLSRYREAREMGLHSMADELLAIADTTEAGVTVTRKMSKDGQMYDETRRADVVEHRKLRIHAREWLLARLLPTVYGERVETKHQLVDGNSEPLDAAELARHVAFLLAMGMQASQTEGLSPQLH